MSGLGRNSGRRVVLFILFVFERGEIWWNLSVDISMFRGRILSIHMHLISKGFKNRTQQRWRDLSICSFTLSAYQYIYIYVYATTANVLQAFFRNVLSLWIHSWISIVCNVGCEGQHLTSPGRPGILLRGIVGWLEKRQLFRA